MRENRHFICSTDISGREPVKTGGVSAVSLYRTLIDRIEALVGREAASLFAEPVLPGGGARIATAVSWYCAFEGAVIAIDSIDDIARRPVAEKLAARLQALSPALRDPELGEALACWLNIASPADMISVGGEPLFVNWGFLPAGVADDQHARNDHFNLTLGRFAPNLSVPPAEVPPPAVTAAQPQQTSGSQEATNVMPQPPLMPPAPPVPTPPSSGGEAPPPPGGLGAPPAGMAGRPSWLGPLIACAMAMLGLIILLLPGVLKYPQKAAAGQEAMDAQRLHAANESLETQLAALQTAAKDKVCRAADLNVQVPGQNGEPSKMELLPRPPEQVPLPGQSNKDTATIAGLLEAATVLVFAAKSEDSAKQGTGFFINDHNIVTNRHVVENTKEGGIVVASRALGGVRHARLVAMSDPEKDNNSINIDLAVLEIDPAPNRISLTVGVTPAKLSTVYIAGFPGFITEKDVEFQNFLHELTKNVSEGKTSGGAEDKTMTMPGPDMRYGRVSNIIKSGNDALPVILHDMQLAPGHSGGPLVDACGRIDGVNSWELRPEDGPQQANIAQDATILTKFLKDRDISFKSDDSPCVNGPAIAPRPAPQPVPLLQAPK